MEWIETVESVAKVMDGVFVDSATKSTEVSALLELVFGKDYIFQTFFGYKIANGRCTAMHNFVEAEQQPNRLQLAAALHSGKLHLIYKSGKPSRML